MVRTKLAFIFLNSKKWNFNDFVSFFMTMKINTTSSSYNAQPSFQTWIVLNFPPNDPHKTTLGITKFWVSDL